MSIRSPKEEMQQLIQQSMKINITPVYDALEIYKKNFGVDDFIYHCEQMIALDTPLVSLVCFDDVSDDYLNDFLSNQKYLNFEIVRLSKDDSCKDILDYFCSTKSQYICFLEPNHLYDPQMITELINCFDKYSSIEVAISSRNFIDSNNVIISHSDMGYEDVLKDTIFNGKVFLEYNINNNINLYGNLSTVMVSTKYVQSIPWTVPNYSFKQINRIFLLYQIFLYGKIGFASRILISTMLLPYSDNTELDTEYKNFLKSFAEQNSIMLSDNYFKKNNPPCSLKEKSITFFYTDKGEYYNLKPIADEAMKRGYRIKFTENIKENAEIGVYCQHICYPENSKFAVILLHDMLQGHNRWPNIWAREPWNKFDIGIVPGKLWAELWSQCACLPYANPRYGTFELGYPKSDLINTHSYSKRSLELKKALNLKYHVSVLYAPSWENDEKEDDFIRALASLPVNLLIKQAHWNLDYSYIIRNIEQMRRLHEGKYENVYYIETEESIMTALELCDLVVSDESSVMTEALLFNKPSIAVIDWLIPDTMPSRFASVPIDYVVKCKKVELRENVEKFLRNDPEFRTVLVKGKEVFSNQGSCCSDILDAIQFYTEGTENTNFMSKKLSSKYPLCSMWD